ncbi:hypothetical protein [Azospirillum argentinense]|uniref:Uncharacterized protein n=1 Tax=Azospirillum argentinense TaxID=2970906 RepID=A0A5B0L4T7_9PROT|nr:hypothetical protein FH063_001256 [Azospirillum argentinense]
MIDETLRVAFPAIALVLMDSICQEHGKIHTREGTRSFA